MSTLTDTTNTTAGSPYHTRAYRFDAKNGVMTSSYIPGFPADKLERTFSWVKDPAAGAVWAQTGLAASIPAWQAASSWHANITFRGAVRAYFVNEAALKTALLAIKRAPDKLVEPIDPKTITPETPKGTPAFRPLFTEKNAADIVQLVVDYTRLDGTQISGKVATFITKVSELRTLLEGGFVQANNATLAAFYAKAETVAAIDVILGNSALKLHARAKEISGKYADLGTKRTPATSICLSNDVQATAISLLKTQLATYFKTDAASGIKYIDQPALIGWLNTDMGLISNPINNDYGPDSTKDVALFDAFLSLAGLGYTTPTVSATAVTAAQVNTKKAEVEALGQQIDDHYSTMGTSSDTGALESAVKSYMDSTDLTGQFPEIVRRIVDPRFYVQTWVTAWGEESAPSPPSAMVEPDQNDVCIVKPATSDGTATVAPSGLGIVGYRLYRSNSGNASSGFQLVPDLGLISEKKPPGSPEDVVRATYKEINRSGILGVTDFEVSWWLNAASTTSYVDKTLDKNMQNVYTWTTAGLAEQAGAAWLRSGMLTAALGDTTMVAGIARVLSGDYSLKLSDGSYNCFKLALGEYPDAVKSAQLGEALPTTTWLTPPEDLRGLTGMANGVMAGFTGNTVCFSEAYTPHAWPVEYQITVDYPVVAVAAFGQTLFVGTQGSVYLMSGSDPSSMSSQIMPGGQSCSSARSVVAVDNGVLFASPEGICLADLSGVKVLTTGLFTRSGGAGWTAMNPSTMIAAMHDGVYYLLYERTSGTLATTIAAVVAQTYDAIAQVPATADTAFWVNAATVGGWSLSQLRQSMLVSAASFITTPGYEENARIASQLLLENSQMGCYALDMVSGKLTQVDVFGTAFHRDVATDRLYVAHGTKIRDLFSASTTRRSVYRTGIIQTPKQSPFGWLQVDGDFNGPVVVKWYGDGVLRYSKTLTALEPVRLPAGRYREHEVEVISTGRVTSVTLAGTTQELQDV